MNSLCQTVLAELGKLFGSRPRQAHLVLPVEAPDLVELLPRLRSEGAILWQDREGGHQLLGLPPWETTGPLASVEKLELLVRENPHLAVMGGPPFSSDTSATGEWGELVRASWIVPSLCFERKGNKGSLTVNCPQLLWDEKSRQLDFLGQVERSLSRVLPRPPHWRATPLGSDDRDKWNQATREALSAIECNDFQKVVLARRRSFSLEGEFHPRQLFAHLSVRGGAGYRHYREISPGRAFMSLSPERLFERRGRQLRLDALAGTRPRGGDPQEERRFARELQTSDKEAREHRLVVAQLLKRLEALGVKATCSPRKVLALTRVQHLHTTLGADVGDALGAGPLLAALHPTAAVGGIPTRQACGLIARHEDWRRGLYAAPFGVLQRGRAHFAVGIRSALYEGGRLHVYGGAGIVAGSRGEEEWKETEDKMGDFLKNL